MFQINIPINKIAQPGSALHIMLIFVSNKIDIEILISKTKFKSTFIIVFSPRLRTVPSLSVRIASAKSEVRIVSP